MATTEPQQLTQAQKEANRKDVKCVVCGRHVPDTRIAQLERAQKQYAISRGTWTIRGVATCGTECNRFRKRDRMKLLPEVGVR